MPRATPQRRDPLCEASCVGRDHGIIQSLHQLFGIGAESLDQLARKGVAAAQRAQRLDRAEVEHGRDLRCEFRVGGDRRYALITRFDIEARCRPRLVIWRLGARGRQRQAPERVGEEPLGQGYRQQTIERGLIEFCKPLDPAALADKQDARPPDAGPC